MTRNILVLWRWSEALECEGKKVFSSAGGQMKAVKKDDRLFICATSENELYLLGLLQVREVMKESSLFGDYIANCRNLSGAFKKIPLGGRKWQLRFENTDSDRLNPNVKLALQVRSHRFLSNDSVDLLTKMLGEDLATVERERRFIEGERRATQTMRSVRSTALRVDAKHHWGLRCYCCGFSFEEFYGDQGKDFAIVHHLDSFGNSDGQPRTTSVEEVRIVCANCHYILHREKEPLDVEKLKRRLARKWTLWSSRGVRAR